MAMVSDLVGRQVRDGNGRRATLVDLVADLLGGEHPPITSFVIDCDGQRREAVGVTLFGALQG